MRSSPCHPRRYCLRKPSTSITSTGWSSFRRDASLRNTDEGRVARYRLASDFVSDLPYQAFDCDNHYYEALDAFMAPRPEARSPLCPVGRDQRPAIPRGRWIREPRRRQPDLRPGGQGRRCTTTSAATPTVSSHGVPGRLNRSPPVPRPRRPPRASTNSGSRPCGSSRRSGCSTRSC